jgi:hypothetical protein
MHTISNTMTAARSRRKGPGRVEQTISVTIASEIAQRFFKVSGKWIAQTTCLGFNRQQAITAAYLKVNLRGWTVILMFANSFSVAETISIDSLTLTYCSSHNAALHPQSLG